MFGKLIGNILAIPKEAFAGEIVNNQLNSRHLAIATTGYRIQSCTLQIPDRFGFFSPGPPRLQVHEGLAFIFAVGWICMVLISDAFVVFVCILSGLPTCQRLGAAFPLMIVPGAVILWYAQVHNRRRAPGYEWGDWKLRKD
jgi:hypothetical protein